MGKARIECHYPQTALQRLAAQRNWHRRSVRGSFALIRNLAVRWIFSTAYDKMVNDLEQEILDAIDTKWQADKKALNEEG